MFFGGPIDCHNQSINLLTFDFLSFVTSSKIKSKKAATSSIFKGIIILFIRLSAAFIDSHVNVLYITIRTSHDGNFFKLFWVQTDINAFATKSKKIERKEKINTNHNNDILVYGTSNKLKSPANPK